MAPQKDGLVNEESNVSVFRVRWVFRKINPFLCQVNRVTLISPGLVIMHL